MDRQKERQIYDVVGWVDGCHSARLDDTVNQFEDRRSVERFVRERRRIVEVPKVKATSSDTAKTFQELATQWYKDTLRLSSHLDVILHPAYQQIMGNLGEKAIPFILRELQDFPAEWFWALEHITRQNPVGKEVTKPSEMAKIWIAWGKDNGYL